MLKLAAAAIAAFLFLAPSPAEAQSSSHMRHQRIYSQLRSPEFGQTPNRAARRGTQYNYGDRRARRPRW